MKQLIIDIPDQLEIDNEEAAIMLAAKLYEQGRLSLGQAANLAGYSKRAFMEILGKYGVSVFNYPAEDLEQDIAHAKKYHT